MVVTPQTGVVLPVIEFTPNDAYRDFDAKTRAMLDMSAEEFIQRLDTGAFDDLLNDPESDVPFLAMVSNSARTVPYTPNYATQCDRV